MFCQCVFNKEGLIIDKAGTVEGIDLQSKTINELFKEVGILEEWKIGEEYIANCNGKKFKCVATKLGNNFQFIGVDVTNLEEYKGQFESQNRISDLNMNRLLKALDDLRVENSTLIETNLNQQNLIKNTSHELRTTLTDVVGLVEIIGDMPKDEQAKYLEIIKEASDKVVILLEKFNNK